MNLRPYQMEVARAVMDSVQQGKGLTFSVEIARQGGKNELSAHLEVLLLTLNIACGGSLVKCSPTFKPQTIISMQRLRDRLIEYGFEGIYRPELGYIIALGAARVVFLSAEENSIFELLSEEEKGMDELIREAGLPVGKVSAILLALELKHLIKQLPGQLYIRL